MDLWTYGVSEFLDIKRIRYIVAGGACAMPNAALSPGTRQGGHRHAWTMEVCVRHTLSIKEVHGARQVRVRGSVEVRGGDVQVPPGGPSD